ncbi:AraC family transcriptional regulator [Roseovarius faecimaris]|uniref:AraC family transcriptional regulator n=1 Tax=Roseovarius faecimaris TaxID=2494550 RepID=A0A6I6IK89_9RHOB|nr:helix-turn-helix domain-containing protein [Roseovarius faecimaris]QGX97249.1 AraC family transcriptional regulator [Roseovarius faecimaris]
MLADIDLMIRGGVIGISVLTFAILVSNARTRRKSLPLGALSLALTGMLTREQGISAAWAPEAIDPALFLSHFMWPALTWFVLEIFLDGQERRDVGGPLYLLAGVITALCFVPNGVGTAHLVLSIVLFLALLLVVLRSAKGDLMENRRSFRVVFIGFVCAFGVLKTVFYTVYSFDDQPFWAPTVMALALLIFEIVFAYWALRPGGSLWTEESAPRPRHTPEPVDLVDTYLLEQIDTAMQGELWRREGLTIGEMAEELGVPEHRLRHAINRDLGYRNFPAFVNGYRIAAAKAALSAPENAQKTILEIAYDVGFASLGPFNKAFRAMTGTSPRDFRRMVSDDRSIPA